MIARKSSPAETVNNKKLGQAASTAGLAQLRRLEWRVKHVADSIISGEYRSAFRGRGREFDQVVRYQFGDDVRDIDWNVTARLGEPYRKSFIEEREVTLVLLMEDSVSLQFGSGAVSKREALTEMAGLLSLVCSANRDRLAIINATHGSHWFLPPQRGHRGIRQAAAKLLSSPPPEISTINPIEIPWKFILRTIPRHSILIWLGDFPPRVKPECWPAFRRKFQVMGFRIDDPWERKLPDLGAINAYDPSSGEMVVLDTSSAAHRREHARWNEQREKSWEHFFPNSLNRLSFQAGDSCLHALLKFFQARERRLR